MTGAMLAAMSDAALLAAVRAGRGARTGIGGTTASITVDGVDVFVKLVRLTDREREAGPDCTANLFGLPAWYQYGVGEGSAGFSAWRELAALRRAADGGSTVPLLHHWRVLDHPSAAGTTTDPDGIERAVRFWGGSPAIRARLEALRDGRAVLALALEHVPHTLRGWLTANLAAGPGPADDALTLVERELVGAFGRLRSAGVTHFDGHLDNVLTDGTGIRLADLGLATSTLFDLDDAERRFLARHVDHDVAHGVTGVVNLVVATMLGLPDPGSRNDWVRRCAATGRADGLAGRPAEFVTRYAPVATVVNDVYRRLHAGDVTAPIPAGRVADALARAG